MDIGGVDRIKSGYDPVFVAGELPVAAGIKIQQGQLVAVDAVGDLTNVVANGVTFVGIATQTVDNTGGAARAVSGHYQLGTYKFPVKTGDVVMVGQSAATLDGLELVAPATANAKKIGIVAALEDGHALVQIVLGQALP